MKVVDLSRVEIQTLNGQIVEYNLAKELAEVIFQNTQSITEHAFCMELYKNPVIELTEENKTIIEKYIQQYFKAFVQVAVNTLLTKQ
jgi:hypothetical protein